MIENTTPIGFNAFANAPSIGFEMLDRTTKVSTNIVVPIAKENPQFSWKAISNRFFSLFLLAILLFD